MKYYKALNWDESAILANTKYHLPKGKRPGKWMPKIEDNLKMCAVSYHLCRRGDILNWLAEAIFEAEIKDGAKIIVRDNKILTNGPVRLVRRMSWDNRIAHLFIADCAERVLPIYEKRYPGDHRIRDAITSRRGYVKGDISEKEWRAASTATRSAADAAWSAAYTATRSAADAAWSAWSAADAAWSAADAASAAARSAADAARSATDAARSAADAASAAWSAADTASATWDLERKWQTDRLFEYLMGRRGVTGKGDG